MKVSAHGIRFERDGVYLNTAMYGLPPMVALAAGEEAARDWAAGRVRFDAWEPAVESARESLARLHGVKPTDVALGASASTLVAMVAAGLAPGAIVLLSDDEFLSLSFPFEARAEQIKLNIIRTPRETLTATIREVKPTLVAASLVRPHDGHLLNNVELRAECESVGARLLLDVSQAGWMPLHDTAADVIVGVGHKWFMGPHGTAYLIAGPESRNHLVPLNAGWSARSDQTRPPWGDTRRDSSARGFDQSPAFLAWVIQAEALAVVERIGIPTITAHDLALATQFTSALNLADPRTPIVAIAKHSADLEKLAASHVRITERAGNLRFSFHLHNDKRDVKAALTALNR